MRLRVAHNAATSHPVHAGIEYFADRVAEYSQGRLRFDLFPNAQLGSELQYIEQMQAGTLDAAKVGGASCIQRSSRASSMERLGSTALVYDNALHRTAVQLWEHRKAIQKSLRHKAKELFSLDEKIILYDLFNTYFEGKKGGHSKA